MEVTCPFCDGHEYGLCFAHQREAAGLSVNVTKIEATAEYVAAGVHQAHEVTRSNLIPALRHSKIKAALAAAEYENECE